MSGKNILTLIEDKHFSRAGLADWMNENCPEKSNGEKYTSRDVVGYARRGFMPSKCGGHPLKEISVPRQGLFVEVSWIKNATYGTAS